ncbi:hypothetical protein F5X68DRAFT_39692 [Plectosphaerella plurivora]|uniref:Peptidase M20 dimerisation domain-containing protein n=1 Tax=Plectosphaerella plurivora TaxID=936078 RepID=A0A9P8V4M1_9PEZI|nr:hypothetical protein F5X68DRAFT_39692 [Plectosphaerella plurivora]
MHISRLLEATLLFRLASAAQDVLQQPLSSGLQSPADSLDKPAWRDSLISLHRSLVEISSVTGTEAKVGEFLIDYLNKRGYTAVPQFVPPRDDAADSTPRFNVLASKGPVRDLAAHVVVSSHIDVVPPHIPYGIEKGPVTEDTLIWGRGSVDAKASVAAQIQAHENLIASGEIDDDDILLLFVVGEERWGDGMRTFSDSLAELDPRPRIDAVIFGEPTENKLACGHKGGVFCDLTARGVAGHSGYPWLGKSANELLVRAFYKILETDLGSDERFGNTTFNIGRFDGGVAANVIPDHAATKIAARVAIGPEDKGGEIVKGRIEAILNSIDEEAFTLECSHGYGVVEANCDVEGFETAVMNYGTDIPNLKGDHDRYLYGPGSILVAHGDHENLTVADLEVAVKGFEKLILHALSEPA